MRLTVAPLVGLPEIVPGADLAAEIARVLLTPGDAEPLRDLGSGNLRDGDVLVIAHKVVSKAEGRTRDLGRVRPGVRASALAREQGKDPRHVQVVLDETDELLRAEHGVLICVTHHGFICANAGVDASNVPGADMVVLLPRDPDRSARQLRHRLNVLFGVAPGIVITDSFGRAWRHGQCDVAIGCAGIAPLQDWRGRRDAYGRELKATWLATADELAAAADLARSKDAGQPVVLIRGAEGLVSGEDGPGAAALIRPEPEDLFR